MFSWEYSEFMRVGVDPASDKSDKSIRWTSQNISDRLRTNGGCSTESTRHGHRTSGGVPWCWLWILASCGMEGGASIDQACSDTSDGCFNPTSKFPMRSSICCLIPWRSHCGSQLALTPRSLDTGPPRVSRDVWSGGLVRDLLSPVGCGLRTLWIRLVLAHLKDAERPLQLGECCCEEGVNSTLSRSLDGWCVLNCIPHENHKVSQHNTAL